MTITLSTPTLSRAERVAEAERVLSLFHKRGDVIELRIVLPQPAAGYFIDPHTAARAAISYDDQRAPSAVYFVMNTLAPELYERSPDKITLGLKPVASDKDVVRRLRLLLDFDVKRETKTSATEEELEESRLVMEQTCRELTERFGWPNPFATM